MDKDNRGVDSGRIKSGIKYGIAAYTAWGVLPVFWKALKQVAPSEILAHRIVWSFIFVAIIVSVTGGWRNIRLVLQTKTNRWGIILGASLISVNWFVYIWAVNSNHIVEASLGYYINPLFTVFLGVVVLKERMDFGQLVSLVLAFTGVVILTVQYGRIPWVAILLAVSFGLYSLVKKTFKIDTLPGLALETMAVLPVALAYLSYLQYIGVGSMGKVALEVNVLVVCSGIITATPLLWFAQAAKRVPLSTLGFIQYLSPSISLVLGVFVYGESFSKVDIVSFGLIWTALALYSVSRFKIAKSNASGAK